MDRGLEKFFAPVKARLSWKFVIGFNFVFEFIEKFLNASCLDFSFRARANILFEIQTETIYILMLDCRAGCVCCGNSFILCRYFRFSHNSLKMALLPKTISFKSIERAII